ncbi:MAG: Glu/Leu/Phe/Val dehydrogenase family protein, partial [Deltaproteobacteria bacterium]|nr:Glu/Leu/Phe/Val dehydrogenase family protein [Deltaproteobacteria bacterium]
MKTDSIFDFMEQKHLTSLEIFFNHREDRFFLRGMKEWDDDLEFSSYATNFTYLDILTENYTAEGTQQLVTDFRQLGLREYLERIQKLMREGRHEGIEFFYHRRNNIRVAFCKHSVTIGLNNRHHATRAGAMRRHGLAEPEIDVI